MFSETHEASYNCRLWITLTQRQCFYGLRSIIIYQVYWCLRCVHSFARIYDRYLVVATCVYILTQFHVAHIRLHAAQTFPCCAHTSMLSTHFHVTHIRLYATHIFPCFTNCAIPCFAHANLLRKCVSMMHTHAIILRTHASMFRSHVSCSHTCCVSTPSLCSFLCMLIGHG